MWPGHKLFSQSLITAFLESFSIVKTHGFFSLYHTSDFLQWAPLSRNNPLEKSGLPISLYSVSSVNVPLVLRKRQFASKINPRTPYLCGVVICPSQSQCVAITGMEYDSRCIIFIELLYNLAWCQSQQYTSENI